MPLRLDRSALPLFAENRIFLDFADYPDGPYGGELLRLLHAIADVPLSEEGARFAAEQAAAKSVFLGTPADLEKANDYAARVNDIVGTNAWPSDYWKTATVAEAFLMQKNYPKAAEIYRAAIAMAPKEMGSHGTSWTQASRLMAKRGATAEEQALIKQAFGRITDGQS